MGTWSPQYSAHLLMPRGHRCHGMCRILFLARLLKYPVIPGQYFGYPKAGSHIIVVKRAPGSFPSESSQDFFLRVL